MKTFVRACFLGLALAILGSCGGSKSKTTVTNSTKFSTLGDKKEFLERYVNFKRVYDDLDFDISFIDGREGMAPGPSEWDIRVSAKVPADTIDPWVSGMKAAAPSDTGWVSSIPNAPTDLKGFQWCSDDGRVVGVSRGDGIVLYRNHSN